MTCFEVEEAIYLQWVDRGSLRGLQKVKVPKEGGKLKKKKILRYWM